MNNIEFEMVYVDTSTPKRPRLRIEYPNGHIVDLLPHNAWYMGTWLDGHQPYAVHEGGEWKAKRLMRTELEYGRWVLPGLPKRVVSTEQVHAMTRSLGCRVRMLVDDVDDADERDQSYTRLLNAIRYAQAAGNHIRADHKNGYPRRGGMKKVEWDENNGRPAHTDAVYALENGMYARRKIGHSRIDVPEGSQRRDGAPHKTRN